MIEKLFPLKFPPGFYRNGTKYEASSRWHDGNLVRFFEGAIRPVRGWRIAFDGNNNPMPALKGVPRSAFGWRSATGGMLLAVGTTRGLFIIKDGSTHDITPLDFVTGRDSASSAAGNGNYGSGNYGAGLYGVGKAPLAAQLTDADTWQLDAIGDVLVACPTNGGRLYVWTGDVQLRATSPIGSPEPNRGVVITPEGFVMVLGAAGDVRSTQWADQNSFTDWVATDLNAAGDFPLTTPGRIMCGRRTKAQTLIFTDADMHSATYIGGQFVYSFKEEGAKCGIIAPQAVAIFDTSAIWMGRNSFFGYDGFVKPIPCDVQDYVFDDFNMQQASKVFAVTISEFGEVWFFYPSAGSEENDRYVVYNWREKHWTTGTLSRTAAIDRDPLPNPTMFDATGTIYTHELASGARIIPASTILFDSLEDTNGVLLENHIPVGGTVFSWVKIGDTFALNFDTNVLRFLEGAVNPTLAFYVANIALGATDYEVNLPIIIGTNTATDHEAGVGARMNGAVGNKAGYYFTARSNVPSVRLFALDAAGATLWSQSANIPSGMLGSLANLRLRVIGSRLLGFLNNTEMLSRTDTTYASGKAGLVGSWPDTLFTAYTDSFTDTDGTLLTAHTPDGAAFTWTKRGTTDITIQGNKAISAAPIFNVAASRHTGTANASDGGGFTMRAVVNIAAGSADGTGVGILLLQSTTDPDGYRLLLSTVSFSTDLVVTLQRVDNGVLTTLDGGTFDDAFAPPAPGAYELKLVLGAGGALTGIFNGVTRVSATDTTYTAPDEIGLEVRHRTDNFDLAVDSISAGSLTAPAAQGPIGPFEVRGIGTVTQAALEQEGNTKVDDAGNLILIPFIESGPLEIDGGDNVARVQRIVPDEKNLGDVRARFFTAMFPTETETERGPYTLTNPTSVRFSARQIRLRLEEAEETNWRIGVTRLGIIREGKR